MIITGLLLPIAVVISPAPVEGLVAKNETFGVHLPPLTFPRQEAS